MQRVNENPDPNTTDVETTDPVITQPSAYPDEGIMGDHRLQEADAWLDNLAENYPSPAYNMIDTAESPATSLATDTLAAHGTIFKGCTCPAHQDIYDEWPTSSAELVIARCMRTCPYCGRDFQIAGELRQHLKAAKYADRHLTIQLEARGMASSSTPSWTHRPQAQPPQNDSAVVDTEVIWVTVDDADNSDERRPEAVPAIVETNPVTTHGIYKACTCPEHQAIYDTWPTRDADLYIAVCMTICPYCGHDSKTPGNLKKHMARMECPSRNLEIKAGRPEKNSPDPPKWESKDTGPRSSQPSTEPQDRLQTSYAATDSNVIIGVVDNEIDAQQLESLPVNTESSPVTANGIYRACKCLHHQTIYDTWPTRDAQIYIASCMRKCTYCGDASTTAGNLRQHMSRKECPNRNLAYYRANRDTQLDPRVDRS